MGRVTLLTYKDLVDHLVDWMGANPSAEAHRDARRAILSAMEELTAEANWSYLYDRYRVTTSAPYNTGTIAYDHTGGTNERMVTLTDGIWPDWADQGTLLIGTNVYEVSSRISDSIITLTSNTNPGEDLSAGTTYTLYRDTFPLPSNFTSMGEMVAIGQQVVLTYEHPNKWLARQRTFLGTGTPRTYCVRGNPNYMGILGLSLYPPPDNVYSLDMIYKRSPRELKVDDYSTGTVTCSTASLSITGSGTSWSSKHVGSIIRLSSSTTTLPTGAAGSNPAEIERVITAVSSATSCTVDELPSSNLTGVKYVISDPVDIEAGSMKTALLRGCEYQIAVSRRMQEREIAERAYKASVISARESDSRNFRPDVVGWNVRWPMRMANMPYQSGV